METLSSPTHHVTIQIQDREPSLRATMLAGLMVILAAFGGFIGWGLLARLDSAAIAPGFVIVDTHRKTVQHLEGGILHELLVREGDLVEAGQVLLRLDGTRADTALGQLRSQRLAAFARLARLRAELAEQLHRGGIAAAGLDVFEEEPKIHPKLLSAPNATLLPHVASATLEARTKMGFLAVNAIIAILEGKPEHSIPNLIEP